MHIPHQNIINALNLHAEKTGVELFFVGGIVRDILMGNKISDIDIVVVGNAIEFCKSYKNGKVISAHPDFGTCKIEIEGINIDFASTREEIYPKSGCLPVVKNIGCPLELDVLRRDFTINAIAINLKTLEIVDHLSGKKDLQAKKLKITHPKSFIDDPTRILRGLDFKERFNFNLENETQSLQKEFLEQDKIEKEGLSTARVDLTLKKVLKNKNAYKTIQNEKMYKIFQSEKPELNMQKIENAIELFKANPIFVRFRAIKNEFPKHLNLNFKTNYEIYNAFKNFSTENLALYYAKYNCEYSLKFQLELKKVKIFVNGDEILNLGFLQGEIIGKIIEKLIEAKLNFPQNSPKNLNEEIQFIRENFT